MTLSILILLAACTEAEPQDTSVEPTPPVTPTPEPDPWAATVVQVGTASVFTEEVTLEPSDGAAPLAPADTVSSQGDETYRIGALGDVELLAYGLAPVLAATEWEGSLLLATTDGLAAWNQGLVPLDLADLVGGVTSMLALPSGLWMQTDAGLVVVRDGQLTHLTIDDAPAQGFARGASGAAPVIWTTAGDQVVALNFTPSGLTLFESIELFGEATDIAASSDGRVLAIADGWLVQRTPAGEWSRLDLGSPVRELLGQRGSDTMWVRTDEAWLYTPDIATFEATDIPTTTELVEDDHGRLTSSGPAGVVRYSVGLPLLLIDLPGANVITPTIVGIVPTAPDLDPVLSVSATDGSSTVNLPVVDYSFLLDPDMGSGVWTISASAAYPGGVTSEIEAVVQLGAVVTPTWDDDIEAISETFCEGCHFEGSTTLVDLSSKSAWESYFIDGPGAGSAGILERIQTANMPPPGNPAPAPADIVEVELWRDGGFL